MQQLLGDKAGTTDEFILKERFVQQLPQVRTNLSMSATDSILTLACVVDQIMDIGFSTVSPVQTASTGHCSIIPTLATKLRSLFPTCRWAKGLMSLQGSFHTFVPTVPEHKTRHSYKCWPATVLLSLTFSRQSLLGPLSSWCIGKTMPSTLLVDGNYQARH